MMENVSMTGTAYKTNTLYLMLTKSIDSRYTFA